MSPRENRLAHYWLPLLLNSDAPTASTRKREEGEAMGEGEKGYRNEDDVHSFPISSLRSKVMEERREDFRREGRGGKKGKIFLAESILNLIKTTLRGRWKKRMGGGKRRGEKGKRRRWSWATSPFPLCFFRCFGGEGREKEARKKRGKKKEKGKEKKKWRAAEHAECLLMLRSPE